MGRSKKERYQQAIDYLTAIDAGLGADVAMKVSAQVDDADQATDALIGAGAEITLKGGGYWKTGSPSQHEAVRALLLCQLAYFRPPHAPQPYANGLMLTQTRTACLNLSQDQVNREIGYYLLAPNPALDELAASSLVVSDVAGVVDHLQRKRTDTNVSGTPVCYHGVVSWLFHAGFVSKRWLAREANTLNAYSCNKHLGDGLVLDDPADWAKIPRGYIWNIHRQGDKTTCHWGVSLGGGRAVACNNTDESPFQKLAYETSASGRVGDTFYGVFDMAEICNVVAGTVKYGHSGKVAPKPGDNIVVRQINPLQQNYY